MKKRILPGLAISLLLINTAWASTGNSSSSTAQGYKQPVTPAAATEESFISGTFDMTSNYMFRGISNSNNLPAAQGGLTFTMHSTGLYFNLWGSNVNFSDPQGNLATVEFDTIIGIANSVGDNFSYDINFDRYNYPKAASSYSELIANAKWYFLTAQIGYSSNVYNLHGVGTYYNLGFKYAVPAKIVFGFEDVSIAGGVGHYSMGSDTGLSSYDDYNLQISKTLGIYNIALQWTDAANSAFLKANDPVRSVRGNKLLATVTASF